MKQKIRVRIDFDKCRLFDEKITSDELDHLLLRFKKKMG